MFYKSQFKKSDCKSTHGYNRKTWVDIPCYIIIPCLRKLDPPMQKLISFILFDLLQQSNLQEKVIINIENMKILARKNP